MRRRLVGGSPSYVGLSAVVRPLCWRYVRLRVIRNQQQGEPIMCRQNSSQVRGGRPTTSVLMDGPQCTGRDGLQCSGEHDRRSSS